MEAIVLETAKVAMRVFLGLMYVSVGDSPASEIVGKGENAEGEVVEDGKVDDDSCGDNGDALCSDGDDNESEGDDAGDQQGSDDSFNENGDKEDEDEELSDEEEEEYSSSDSDEDEEPLLDHAMEVYASDSFLLFRHEYEKRKALSVDCVDESGPDWKYEVTREEDKDPESKCYKVSALFFGKTVDCCCNHFAVTGMLCSHALAVLMSLRIGRIPGQYLLKWRLKSMNQSLLGDTSFQKRRKHFHSHDDCLNFFWKKKKTGEYTEEHKGRLFILPTYRDDKNCEDTNHLGSPILIHAKQVYVSKAYELFREEHRKSEYYFTQMYQKFVDWRGIIYEFEVNKPGQIDQQKVHAEARDGTIKCRCRKFETSGILCAHALAVFDSICIVKIPHQYLVSKFLKDPNMAADQNIHGPEYKDMLTLTISMINTFRRTFLPNPYPPRRSHDEEAEALLQ